MFDGSSIFLAIFFQCIKLSIVYYLDLWKKMEPRSRSLSRGKRPAGTSSILSTVTAPAVATPTVAAPAVATPAVAAPAVATPAVATPAVAARVAAPAVAARVATPAVATRVAAGRPPSVSEMEMRLSTSGGTTVMTARVSTPSKRQRSPSPPGKF